MKIREKFNSLVPEEFGGMQEPTLTECEKIADEFAISFAEWVDDNYFRMGRTNLWSESTDWENNIKITTKELLEIFKKEKGL